MKNKLTLLALLSASSLEPLALHAQGSLTPPGAPAPTMLTLSQIEPRTPISSVPYTITNPGSYYLVSNLNLTINTNAITIATNEVTLDLNGFTISTTVFRGGGDGILLNGGNTDLTIFNGHITGGSFQYLGSGITYNGASPVNVHVSNVSVAECIANGIYLGTNSSTLVEGCTLQVINVYGIEAGIIIHSSAQSGNSAIIANNTASDCVGASGTGDGVLVNGTANNCYGSSYSGTGVSAITANICYGTSGTGDGLDADTAAGCEGNCYSSTGSSYGLNATTANNCKGTVNNSGVGLNAQTASNCYGVSSGDGIGLSAATANNCYGFGYSGEGLYAEYIAIGCVGFTSSGTGLGAIIANSSYSSSGDSGITLKYNMP